MANLAQEDCASFSYILVTYMLSLVIQNLLEAVHPIFPQKTYQLILTLYRKTQAVTSYCKTYKARKKKEKSCAG